uniref:Uncharacterized protein n=1 Tax=Arundo donax TaxID=35708 RepID=A0A0A9F4S7_ARUDO
MLLGSSRRVHFPFRRCGISFSLHCREPWGSPQRCAVSTDDIWHTAAGGIALVMTFSIQTKNYHGSRGNFLGRAPILGSVLCFQIRIIRRRQRWWRWH